MTAHADDHSWMLEKLTVKGVRHAVVLTSDGLPKARSERTSSEVADRLAATCAGLKSLGQSVASEFGTGGTPRQVLVEFDGGFLFVRGAGDGSCLAVVTEPVVDPALIAQQMQAQVLIIGERAMSTPARQI
jgi:predicted regulator of Ras-like GTPase activity (Roadblock/LC7/MglB family)